MFKAPRGTEDILPAEQSYWDYVREKARLTAGLYGYQRIDTPAFEEVGLFKRSVGEGTDIVNKEMYIFKDRSDNELSLRPEGTASVCRSYIEHGMSNLPQPVKLYYFADIFRYERPQAGRYRLHHQFGCEVIGDASPLIDAEVIDMALSFFKALGLRQHTLYLNSIGCKKCRSAYLSKLTEYYANQATQLCEDCSSRLTRNPLRLLDCKKPGCQSAADVAPRSTEFLCNECGEHFTALQHYLGLAGIQYALNHRLVRGLDYYTKTVFEIQPMAGGSQSALGGGGRYDDLITELGGRPSPAMGFAAGMERIIINLKEQRIEVPAAVKPALFIAFMGDSARDEAFKLASELRCCGISVQVSSGERSLKAQLRQANAFGAYYTAILGEEEMLSGFITLRDMGSSEQQQVQAEGLKQILIAL